MACFHPLLAFARTKPDGKKDLKFVSQAVFDDPQSRFVFPDYPEKLTVPCGQCVGCRLKRSSDWATRSVLESMQYKDNYFVTLTYDPEHLPVLFVPYQNYCTGELTDELVPSLVPDDLKKFMKDLRRYYEYHYDHTGIRFIACGEYGDENHRPHYHVILYNCPVPDLQFAEMSKKGSPQFSSKILKDIWSKGRVMLGDANFASAGYLARYCMKSYKGKNDQSVFQKPFFRCSTHPGIANAYYKNRKDWIYKNDSIVVPTATGSVSIKPPSYFDRLYSVDNWEDLLDTKEKRKIVALINNNNLDTSLSRGEYLNTCELNKLGQVGGFSREV